MNANQRRKQLRSFDHEIPDRPVLEFLRDLPCWEGSTMKRAGTWFDYTPRPNNTVVLAMPEGTPEWLVLGKMKALIRRGLVSGCGCGCRGDFELTEEGRKHLASPVDTS